MVSEQYGYYVELDIWHSERDYAAEFFAYREQSENSQFNLSAAIYQEKMKQNFNFSSDAEMMQYLDLIMALMDSKQIQQALNNMIQDLPMPSIGSRQLHISAIVADLQKNSQKMTNYLNQLDSIFTGMLSALSSFSQEDLLRMQVDGNILNPAIQQKIEAIWGVKLSSGVLKASDNYSNLSARAKAQYRSLISRFSALADSGLYGAGGFNVEAMSKSKDFSALLSPIVMFLQTLVGFASEYVVAENLNKLTNELISLGNGIPNVKVSSSTVGTQSGGVFSTGTTDLAIHLTPDGGSVAGAIEFPDIQASLKRTKIKKDGNIEIHIKDTSFGKLMSAILGSSFSASNLNAFYNLYAANGNNKKYKGEDPVGGTGNFSINEVYNVMSDAMLVAAIAGSMTATDLSMILIVNNQVLSIYDILSNPEKYSVSNNGKLQVKGTNLRPNRKSIQAMNTISQDEPLDQSEGYDRSSKIIAAINAIAVKMSIELKIAGL